MKTRLISLAALLLLAGICTNATAQNHHGHEMITPEAIAEKQSEEIIKELSLDKKDAEAFKAIFIAYKKDISEVLFKGHRKKAEGNGSMKPENSKPTDEDFDRMIREEFDKSQKVLDIRREYYQRFLTVLTPGQTMKMYRYEKKQKAQAEHRQWENQHNRGQKGHGGEGHFPSR